MAKHLQRTIIVTVLETWTLVWTHQDGQTSSNGVAFSVPHHSAGQRPTPIVQTVTVSSSTVTIHLNPTE
jgi:hypothetical protein